jgi:4-hydroxythreonine-4-phosphate dehydrogenase
MAAAHLPRIAVTTGEPAGVGPELVAALAASEVAADLIALGDADLLLRAARDRGLSLRLAIDDGRPIATRPPGHLRCVPIALAAPVIPGRLDPRNAAYVEAQLERAASGCLQGAFDALVTAPVHKGVLNDAGFSFRGHTEFFATRARCEVVMLLVADTLRVALATTHLPLAAVPQAIRTDGLLRTLRILRDDLRRRFGITEPRLAVLGLNPHAGEGGHLGREEIEIIAPAVAALRAEGGRIEGPLAADTAFVPTRRARFDAYLAMYHDQGLAPLKALGFGAAVNVTLGLPFVRTSVDHGTALDLAGRGCADPSSLLAATRLALHLRARAGSGSFQ